MRLMRRLSLLAPAVGAAVLLAACGSSSSHSAVSSGLSTALSYFPTGTPIVATVDTSPNSAAEQQERAIEKQNPDLTLAKAALFAELAKAGINYNQDIKPLFGNPIALGVGAAQVSGNATPFLATWQTGSAKALAQLVTDLHATKTGTHDGATLYSLGSFAFAVDGAQLLISQNAANLTAALDRHGAGAGFSAAEYAGDTSGLPSDAVVSIVGDLQSALDTPSAAEARRVPWVSAIKGYGVTFSSTAKSVALQFRLDTSGHSLSASQLPIAQDSQAPALAIGQGVPIAFGLHDPAQLYTFVLGAERSADPSGYQKLLRQESTAQQQTGVDIDSFVRSLTGDVPTWEKLLAHPGSGTTSTALGGGFYRLTESDGTTLVGGAVGNELLLGNGSVAQERTFAGVAPTPSQGSGAVGFQVALGNLIKLALSRSATASASPFTGELASLFGNLTGSVQATPQALTGSATIQVNQSGG
jgi:hypothetical protein